MLQTIVVQLVEKHTNLVLPVAASIRLLPALRRMLPSAWRGTDSLYFRGFCSHRSQHDKAIKKMWVMTSTLVLGMWRNNHLSPVRDERKLSAVPAGL